MVLGVVHALLGLADFVAVHGPADVIRGPFETIGVESLVCGRTDSVFLFASLLRSGPAGNDVGLEFLRFLAENFDVDFDPAFCAGLFRAVL